MTRQAESSRDTKETKISISVEVDGNGTSDCSTGIPFFDHMLDQIGRHGGLDLYVRTEGDLEIAREAYHTSTGTYPVKLAPPPPLPKLPANLAAATGEERHNLSVGNARAKIGRRFG